MEKQEGGWVSKEIVTQFKLMKSDREVLTIAASIAEMVLQSRISPHPQQLQRLESVRSQVELAKHHLHPSDQLLYFLVDREYYQIRSKLNNQHRKSPKQPIFLTIRFTVFDKETSLQQSAQIWKLALHRKTVVGLEPSTCLHQMVGLVRQVIKQLALSYNFSELIKNREASKKYIIDFKVEVAGDGEVEIDGDFVMWSCFGKMNQNYEAELSCYYRPSVTFEHVGCSPYAGLQQHKKRNNSEQTRVDSCQVTSLKEITSNMKKYRSIDEHQTAFELYDSELQMTIISSDSDSLSHSRHAIQEIALGQVDEFELLIEEEMNEDEMFLIDNQSVFESWQKCLTFNFH